MAGSKIQWTEKVWNPVTGCSKISPGCQNCYAERMSKRLAGRFGYPKDKPFRITLHPDRLDEPLKWRKPSRIFVCSMGDLFHSYVSWNFTYKVFEMMLLADRHTFIVLTKRSNNMSVTMPNIWYHLQRNYPEKTFPLKNVWLGVTAENQEQADKRIPILLQIPAAVRFVSIEPMLGPINLWQCQKERLKQCEPVADDFCNGCTHSIPIENLDWVIVGAESGPKRRYCDPNNMIKVVEQCKEAGVPVFVKQIHQYASNKRGLIVNKDISSFPPELQIQQSPTAEKA